MIVKVLFRIRGLYGKNCIACVCEAHVTKGLTQWSDGASVFLAFGLKQKTAQIYVPPFEKVGRLGTPPDQRLGKRCKKA